MKKVLTLLLFIVLAFQLNYSQSIKKQTGLSKAVKFCIVSDVHFYDTTLGTSGKAFEAYLASDRKMIAQSEAIFESALSLVKQENPSFLLITGDLTKDGEKICHQEMANYLKALKTSGIQTYVIPGNHDVLNYGASSYLTDTAVSIANVTPQEFTSIYADYGYNQAIAKDTASLSYVVEPSDGLWLIAMDACRYKENSKTNTSTTGGKFSANTLAWIESQLKLAKANNKVVIGMVHHGVLEHFTGEKAFFSDYVLDDYKKVDSIFTKYDMRLVFTGHYHAQDITENVIADGKTLYDCETGSLVTYPSPYRVVNIGTDLSVNITSGTVQSINANLGGETFPAFADNFLITGMTQLVQTLLTAPVSYGGYGVSADLASQVSPLLALAYCAHYAGDETPSASTKALIANFLSSTDANTKLIGTMLGSLWTDLPPSDNNTQFDIKFQTTAVEDHKDSKPVNYALAQNYPNPFNPSTIINYQLPKDGFVTLKVFNVLGKEIKTLINEFKTQGSYNISFDGTNFASGMYFYQLRVSGISGSSNNFTSTRKMILIK
jgi:3',5'-cyclic AMP phosphodiesterase CpdA